MPERGWATFTVREKTAEIIKKESRARGLTVDEYVSSLLNPGAQEGWKVCDICGVKLKAQNFQAHMAKVHGQR